MTSRWRLINGEERYDIKADPGQQKNVAVDHPQVANRLTEFYDAWWGELEPTFSEATAIYLGHPADNPARLTSHDWITAESTPWNQSHVRQALNGKAVTGYWNVQVFEDGEYKISLRRWLEEADVPIDYCGGCAKIDIDLGNAAFLAGEYRQRLSLYDAESTVSGDQVRLRCLVSANRDVMAIEIEDLRESPREVQIKLSTWRSLLANVGDHVADVAFHQKANSVSIVHTMRERDYYCSSAVAVTCSSPDVHIETAERAFTITVPAKRANANGKTTVYVSSAASFQPDLDVNQAALRELTQVSGSNYDDLRATHTRWWHDFWSGTGFVHISSDDDVAQFMQAMRTLHLYYAASSSRGSRL